jgi:hypothetical protein
MPNDTGDGIYWIEIFWSVLRRKSVPEWVRELFRPGNTLGLGSAWYSYVSCFSGESDLQDQWDNFADHGRGCAIELSFPKFKAASDGGKAYGWTPMFYDAEGQKRHAVETVDAAIQLYRAEGVSGQDARAYWSEAAFSFLWCGTRFKRPEFSHQHEWRIFLSRPSSFEGVAYFGEQRRRYIRWPLPEGLIAGLVKGPKCDLEDGELAALMKAAGYPVNIRVQTQVR